MVNKKTLDLIKKYEGLKLHAYKCPADVWTIGFGSTFYPNGTKVKEGDVITIVEAESILLNVIEKFANQVKSLIKVELNENQFGALVSFAYNIGVGNLQASTLLKLINKNPNNPEIKSQFNKWVYAGGKKLDGLVKRRKEESELYFS